MLSIVEQEYQSRMAALSPKERVARAQAMFCWTRELMGRRIQQDLGPLPTERLKWEIALRQYGSDVALRAMIEQRLLDVSR